MFFFKKKSSFGGYMLLLIMPAFVLAKKEAISIQLNKKVVMLRAEKRSLDDIILAVADYCSISISLQGEKWPVVSVLSENKGCEETFLFLTRKYQLKRAIRDGTHVIDSSQDGTELIQTRHAAKEVYALLSREIVKRHQIFVAGPQQLAIQKGSLSVQKVIEQIDSRPDDFLLTVFMMAINLDHSRSRQNIIELISKYFLTKKLLQ